MKKFKQIAYIILIAIVIIFGFVIYTNANKKEQPNQQEKVFAEVQYLESKIVGIFNEMNQIEMKNYDISVTDIPKQEIQGTSSQQSSGGGGGSSSGQQSSGESGSSSAQEEEGAGGDSKSSSKDKNPKQMELERKGVLTNKKDINWDYVKSEIEIIYSSLPTITLELYQLSLKQDDVLNFNKEFDNLTVAVEEKNKEKTMAELAKAYEFVFKFAQSSTNDETKKIVIETKMNLFKAYSKLDLQDWNSIAADLQNGINAYARLLTNTNIDASKNYSINKGYIVLNELQNAVNLKDTRIFLIKYKNLLEELNHL